MNNQIKELKNKILSIEEKYKNEVESKEKEIIKLQTKISVLNKNLKNINNTNNTNISILLKSKTNSFIYTNKDSSINNDNVNTIKTTNLNDNTIIPNIIIKNRVPNIKKFKNKILNNSILKNNMSMIELHSEKNNMSNFYFTNNHSGINNFSNTQVINNDFEDSINHSKKKYKNKSVLMKKQFPYYNISKNCKNPDLKLEKLIVQKNLAKYKKLIDKKINELLIKDKKRSTLKTPNKYIKNENKDIFKSDKISTNNLDMIIIKKIFNKTSNLKFIRNNSTLKQSNIKKHIPSKRNRKESKDRNDNMKKCISSYNDGNNINRKMHEQDTAKGNF